MKADLTGVDWTEAFISYLFHHKALILGLLFFLLLLSNWMVKYEAGLPAEAQPTKGSRSPKGHLELPKTPLESGSPPRPATLTPREVDKVHACFALQDKILERLIFNEMKLRVLENQMLVVWNQMDRKLGQPLRTPCPGRPSSRRHSAYASEAGSSNSQD
ncbi:testis-expressed protein 46 [Tachyglossus aculeatus]|uniref:testis-expressed protein 46 n=1 Tax=Tachyglossus aculeatus TaxID=9261 RepID=UPI0018F79124|nr:testis-expressed protein 46 [Tachyglossus aculeatus]XP_038613882.1 testis-expressed protein 46 [Tachyglossus aculeatus]